MKTRLIFLVLLVVCFSCATNNKPVSDAQKEKIKAEVKEVVSSVLKDAEGVNPDMIIGSCLDSPDFVLTYSGNYFSYKQCADMIKSVCGTLKNQKITVTDEKYAVLDNSTVMVTVINKCMINYKDGHSVLQDPWISQFTFKKTDNKWKIISEAESGVEKNVPGESSKELNQVELLKQLIGSWKSDAFQDTIWTGECKSFGNGLACSSKTTLKGKIVREGWGFIGHDKINDKLIDCGISTTGKDISMYSMWFTSPNKFTEILFEDRSNPDKASLISKYEFKSPDLYTETDIMNDKTIATYTFHREKK